MPKIKLTERAVARLTAPDPSGKQVLYWDADLRGFGVLVSGVTNAKTYIVQRRLPNGRQRRVTIEATNALTLEKAREEAENQLHDLRKGNDPKTTKRLGATLRRTLHDFLEARKTLRERSRISYRRAVEFYLKDWLDFALRDITPEMVEKRHAAIQKGVVKREEARIAVLGKRKTRKSRLVPQRLIETAIRPTGNATANGVMVTLRALWNFAAERDPTLPPLNPVRRLRQAWFPVHRRESRVAADALPAFYKAVNALANRTARDYLLLLLFTGLRRSEAAGLRWDDIDFVNKLIRLPAGRTKSGRKLDLPMTDFTLALMVARRAIGKDGSFVFPATSKSGHISEPKFFLSEVAKATGINVCPHDLRRTFLDVAESTEMSVYALKALVNHSAGGDVTAGYLGLTTERLREPAQRVADRMKTLCAVPEASGENLKQLGGLRRP
jgi:integrase